MLPLTSMDGDVYAGGTQMDQVRGWTINLGITPGEFATNKTAGKVGNRPGPLRVSGTFQVYTTAGAVPVLPGVIVELKLYVDATKFWLISDALIVNYSDIQVNRETGAIEGMTGNWAYAGKDDGTFGAITTPDGQALSRSTMTL